LEEDRSWRRGTVPRLSGDQARQAVEDDAEDRLIGGARRQVDLDLLFQFDDAGGDFDETQSQSVELHDAPGRSFGHQPAHRPQKPIGTGAKEEAELVGRGLMAGGAVCGTVVLPCLDVVLRLTARAVEPLIELFGATALQVGDDKAGIGTLGAGLDPRDDALDPTPAAGGIVECAKRRTLPRAGNAVKRSAVVFSSVSTWRRSAALRASPQHPIDPVLAAPVEDLRAGVVRIGTQ
jgi:hypothetical protein